MLIIRLQGISVSGYLSDRFGSRGLATGGALLFGASLVGLMLVPINFSYWIFAALIAVNGIASGMFASPNSSSIMGSVPAHQRGVASGMRATSRLRRRPRRARRACVPVPRRPGHHRTLTRANLHHPPLDL